MTDGSSTEPRWVRVLAPQLARESALASVAVWAQASVAAWALASGAALALASGAVWAQATGLVWESDRA